MRPPQLRMISWRLAALVVLAVALLAISPIVSGVALGACAIWALLGPVSALQALIVATLIAYANPHIVKLNPIAGALLRLVMIVAIVRVLPLLRSSDLRLVWPVWLLGLVSAATSYFASRALEISLMKVVTFTLAATVVLVAFERIRGERLLRLHSWFLTVGISVIVLSALTLLKPGLGIGSDGGLQGLLSQPQALGIFTAPFAAWSLAGVILMRRRASAFELWVAIGTVILVLLTRARTAAFATMFAFGVVLLSRMLSGRRVQQASLGRAVLTISAALVVVLGLAVATGKVASFVTHFAYKGTEKETRSLGAAFFESRGGGILAEWQHFLDSPLIGNGFGVYPDGKFPSGVVEFAGIPISAAVEKGFLPTAILEEGGLIGASALGLLILWLARRAWRCPDLRWRAMFVACLGINIGECVFLSPGGIGILDWLFIGLAMSAYRTALPAPVYTSPTRPEATSEARPLAALSWPEPTA